MLKLFLILCGCLLGNTIYGTTLAEKELLATILVLEAAGEGELGMHAVLNVIANRAFKHKTTLANVVLKPYQFSCINGVTVNHTDVSTYVVKAKSQVNRFEQAISLLQLYNLDQLVDITKGATHYHTKKIKPYWSNKLEYKCTIGNHVFYKE